MRNLTMTHCAIHTIRNKMFSLPVSLPAFHYMHQRNIVATVLLFPLH